MKRIVFLTKEEKRYLFILNKGVKEKNDKLEEKIRNGGKIAKKEEASLEYTKKLAKGLYKKLYETRY